MRRSQGSRTAAAREIVTVAEGALDPAGDRLATGAIAPVLSEIARLRADHDARVALAARALTGSLTGLGESIDQIADDADHEAIDVEALRRIADRAYETALEGLRHEVARGTFLSEEALRQWQTFVGADQMTRFFSEGIGRLRGAIAAVLRPATAPVAEVRAATTEDLTAVARLQAAEAARRTATSWSETPRRESRARRAAGLWVPSPISMVVWRRVSSAGSRASPRRSRQAAGPSGCSHAAPRSASTPWARG